MASLITDRGLAAVAAEVAQEMRAMPSPAAVVPQMEAIVHAAVA